MPRFVDELHIVDWYLEHFLKATEGGALEHDSAGLTRWGINEKYDHIDPTNLSWEGAKAIYIKHYWQAVSPVGSPSSFHYPLNVVIMDTFINPISGIWSDIKTILHETGKTDAEKAQEIITARVKRYVVQANAKYMHGLVNRANNLATFIKGLSSN